MTGAAAAAAVVVSDLRVELAASGLPVVEEIAFRIARGRSLALVGESGSGKTTVALALLGYARLGSRITAGRVEIDGVDLLALREGDRRRLRRRLVSYVGQDPGASLNPARRIGAQMRELLRGRELERGDLDLRIREFLERVGLPGERFLRRYPHELSGGEAQRVVIAMALAAGRALVVLDEPTTGLDVVVQREVLALVRELRDAHEAALLYVSHDLALVSQVADEVVVLYGGRAVEAGRRDELLRRPLHPYTRQLLEAVPDAFVHGFAPRTIPGTGVGVLDRPPGCHFAPRCPLRIDRCSIEVPAETVVGERRVRCFRAHALEPFEATGDASDRPVIPARRPAEVLRVVSLSAWHGRHAATLREISFALVAGQALGVVGQTGSGKTTLARCLAGLHPSWSGEIRFRDAPLAPMARTRPEEARRGIQLVYQNPRSSLNPRQTVLETLARVVRRFEPDGGRRRDERVAELLDHVRLPATLLDRYPRELSGGEAQRVAIARALAARPQVLVCDEPTSSLDVSVQASILDLLRELQTVDHLSLVFVSHDLGVVQALCTWVLVLRDGIVVEAGPTRRVFAEPAAAYTRQLVAALPRMPV